MISCQRVSDIATLLKLLIKQVILEEHASSDDATTWVWNGRQNPVPGALLNTVHKHVWHNLNIVFFSHSVEFLNFLKFNSGHILQIAPLNWMKKSKYTLEHKFEAQAGKGLTLDHCGL